MDSKFVCKLGSEVIYLATESIFHFYGYQDGSSHEETSFWKLLKSKFGWIKKAFYLPAEWQLFQAHLLLLLSSRRSLG